MQIEFTEEQFENLLKLTYLGNWVVNACRLYENRIRKYDDLEQLILFYAKDFGLAEYVDYDIKDSTIYPNRKFEEETDIEDLIGEYENEVFWDEIIDRLADRDFLNNYTLEEIGKMSREERFGKICEFEERWGREFEKYGIDRLEIKSNE